MHDEAAAVPVPFAVRVRAGLRKPSNWMQLVRFGVVGGGGYVVNLAVFSVAVHVAGMDYRLAAVVAFVVAVLNNFAWNRHWTFRAHDGHPGFQAARFLVVSVAAFVVSFGVLQLLVGAWGLAEVPAQAAAVIAATPLSFVGNKLWSFGP